MSRHRSCSPGGPILSGIRFSAPPGRPPAAGAAVCGDASPARRICLDGRGPWARGARTETSGILPRAGADPLATVSRYVAIPSANQRVGSACRGEKGCDRDRPPDARAAKHSTRSVAPRPRRSRHVPRGRSGRQGAPGEEGRHDMMKRRARIGCCGGLRSPSWRWAGPRRPTSSPSPGAPWPQLPWSQQMRHTEHDRSPPLLVLFSSSDRLRATREACAPRYARRSRGAHSRQPIGGSSRRALRLRNDERRHPLHERENGLAPLLTMIHRCRPTQRSLVFRRGSWPTAYTPTTGTLPI